MTTDNPRLPLVKVCPLCRGKKTCLEVDAIEVGGRVVNPRKADCMACEGEGVVLVDLRDAGELAESQLPDVPAHMGWNVDPASGLLVAYFQGSLNSVQLRAMAAKLDQLNAGGARNV